MQVEQLGSVRLGRMRRVLNAALGRPGAPPNAKSSMTGSLIAIDGNRQPQWAPRDYATFAREGMMQNPVAYRSVRMIAEACASVPLLLYDRNLEIEEHPLLELLASPAPAQTSVDLLEALFSQLLVSGNAFIEAVAAADQIRELYILRSDRIQIISGANGWGDGYNYTAGGQSVAIEGEAIAGIPRILHMRFYHPLNDHYGLSPIEAAATSIDIHNEASRWNKALLDNSARPSGALVYGASESMSPAQFERLKRELEDSFQGARNAGRPLLLEGGLDWKAMSLSPRDMDFISLKQMAAREIALALGVPPLLLGLPGDNTFSNYQEANRTFWRQTVIPLVTRTAKALSGWLGGGLQLRPDLDQLDALAPDREALWARLDGASFLTDDEKRAAAGYGPRAGGKTAEAALSRKYRSDQSRDDQGRRVDEGGGDGELGDPLLIPVAGRPRGPAPPPKPPVAPGAKPGLRDPSKEPLKDILMPGGKELGVRNPGAAAEVRTVTKGELEDIKAQILAGATEMSSPAGCAGKWYQRLDGTIVGVRESKDFGPTVEVVRSNNPMLKQGYKVHGK